MTHDIESSPMTDEYNISIGNQIFRPETLEAALLSNNDTESMMADRAAGLPLPDELPILPLRGVVVYPLTAVPLTVGQTRSVQLIDEAVLQKKVIGLVASKDPSIEEPTPDDCYTIGTAVAVQRLLRLPDGTIRLLVLGLERIRIKEYTGTQPYLKARVEAAPEQSERSVEVEALRRNIGSLFGRLVELVPGIPEEVAAVAINIEDPRQLAYAIATYMRIELSDAQEILELDNVLAKLHKIVALLNKELEVLELGRKIQTEAHSEMEKVQREYYLREQLKAIQKELGEHDEQQIEVEELRGKIDVAAMPEEAHKEAVRELDRLAKLPTAAAEYGVIRTYLDWLVNLPWSKITPDNLDVAHAREVLDQDHYGLQDIKERILEYLAVRKLKTERASNEKETEEAEAKDKIRREREGVILCFVGPPGVGKTSLGQSIARAMGRKFIRQSLGGVRDEAEIRGFRRTYIGAMPGRFIQGLRRIETRNPIFMLDEVDKLSSDFRGDPASALLEVLDPEQNREFRDHYLDVPFDLSQVIFICTANYLENIPGPLRDRMEVIQLSGYTDLEKIKIAQGYLVQRQFKENGLRADEVSFTDDALMQIVHDYTREAGVRQLEREIGSVCRKLATKIAEGSVTQVTVDAKDIETYLSKPRFYSEIAERMHLPGVATGLVWTPVGGDIIFIEATQMSGARGFQLTGQLGDVMRESAQAALSFVRSRADKLGVPDKFFSTHDLHLHVPAGAVSKDGPSAGVTMATALASLLTGRSVRDDLAMTGEITLRGQVLPVGGIKEKILAAHRAGLRTVILPNRNERDLEDLPEEIRQSMKFILVDQVEQVFDAALVTNGKTRSGAVGRSNGRGRKPKSINRSADASER
jgi:ATP-dependent Lon protease